jgi:hypothetical protein
MRISYISVCPDEVIIKIIGISEKRSSGFLRELPAQETRSRPGELASPAIAFVATSCDRETGTRPSGLK